MLCARRVGFAVTYRGRSYTTADSSLRSNDSSFSFKESATVKSSSKPSFRWTVSDATSLEEQINLFVRVRLHVRP